MEEPRVINQMGPDRSNTRKFDFPTKQNKTRLRNFQAFSPWMVATILRVCFAARNSRYQMPCQVPVHCGVSTGVGPLQVFARTHQLAILDGNRHARADQGRLDVGGEVVGACPRGSGLQLVSVRGCWLGKTYLRHRAGTALPPWARPRARSGRGCRSCLRGHPVIPD